MVTRVLHLVGSPVSEFYADLSRLYAADCLDATADPRRYEFVIAYVSPDGTWRFPASLATDALAAAEPLPVGAAVSRLTQAGVDVAVPQMFCRPGMISYRALLDVLGIPYVGNRADVMAIGADKARAKAIVAAAGVAVPGGDEVRAGEAVTRELPVVVKPADADNSDGIALVREPHELAPALADAFGYGERVLVEDYVELGREVRCGVLERGDELVCLPLEEYDVDAQARPVRTGADKLRRDDAGELGLVAKTAEKAWIVDVADPLTAPVWAAARACHRALGCRDYSLFDFRVDPAGVPHFLEAGLYCSYACTSVVAVMAAAAGVPLTELFDAGLTRALTRTG